MKPKPDKKKRIRNDIILIAVCVCLSAAVLIFVKLTAKAGAVAVVTVDGEEWGRYPLSENITVAVETQYGKNVLVICDGYADITDADCPQGICVGTPPVGKAGETITCLPHRLTVTVEGDGGADFVE